MSSKDIKQQHNQKDAIKARDMWKKLFEDEHRKIVKIRELLANRVFMSEMQFLDDLNKLVEKEDVQS